MNETKTPAKWTASGLRTLKGGEKIVALATYDFGSARRADAAGVHLILVGDSLGMTMLGYDSTIPVTLDEMLHHTAAVARGTTRALVVGDMPFMTYQVSDEQALANAGRFVQLARADAVKIEGGALRAATVRHLVANGIPVMGHIGLTPQSLKELGGYKVQGRDSKTAARLIEDARALDEAGAFAIVLECVPAELGADITAAVKAPTIGIGAGPGCDGQILVLHDLVGLSSGRAPKFVKRYADLGTAMDEAIASYATEVRGGQFPGPEQSYQ
jgi:3-methyl-2-oxobutanoate hydroxymethyltransferase